MLMFFFDIFTSENMIVFCSLSVPSNSYSSTCVLSSSQRSRWRISRVMQDWISASWTSSRSVRSMAAA